jgi:hypothetical protein
MHADKTAASGIAAGSHFFRSKPPVRDFLLSKSLKVIFREFFFYADNDKVRCRIDPFAVKVKDSRTDTVFIRVGMPENENPGLGIDRRGG